MSIHPKVNPSTPAGSGQGSLGTGSPEVCRRVGPERRLGAVERVKNAWYKLVHEDSTPNRIGAGFAIGLFMGIFPCPVVDTLVALAISYLVRANRASCLIGNNFILLIPPLLPVVFGTEYMIGRAILHLPLAPELPKTWNLWILARTQGWLIYFSLWVGALPIAIPSAIGSFFTVKFATARWQARKMVEEHLTQRSRKG